MFVFGEGGGRWGGGAGVEGLVAVVSLAAVGILAVSVVVVAVIGRLLQLVTPAEFEVTLRACRRAWKVDFLIWERGGVSDSAFLDHIVKLLILALAQRILKSWACLYGH